MAPVDSASILRAFYDAFNARDTAAVASCVAPGAQATSMALGTRTGFIEHLQAWGDAFPDGRIELRSMVAQGDAVFTEIVARGTHTGTLKEPGHELPATGRRIELPMAEVFRCRGGKIEDFRVYFDAFTLFRQLGIGAPAAGAQAQDESGSQEPVH
jgi:steroid delta-isomerase-like uncharacterized protein